MVLQRLYFIGRCRLKKEDVNSAYSLGNLTVSDIAREFGVSTRTIHRYLSSDYKENLPNLVSSNVVVLMDATYWGRRFGVVIMPQFRSIILCDLLLYIDVTFWYLSIDLGFFWGSWFLNRHEIPHPDPMGDMIATKKYCLFKEYFRIVCFIGIKV